MATEDEDGYRGWLKKMMAATEDEDAWLEDKDGYRGRGWLQRIGMAAEDEDGYGR